MRLPRTLLAIVLAALIAALAGSAGSADAAPSWAPAETAPIHPGTMMYTDGAQCTANFVYTDSAGNVYVGYAAHCAGKGEATDTNGCNVDSVPLGTKVTFTNDGNLASEGTPVGTGTLAYSSWITEKQLGTKDANTCAYNDLALVRVDPADVANVNPSVPGFGGPTGVGTVGDLGSTVYTYGNSSLRLGITKLSPKQGTVIQNEGNGWSHNVATVTPGIPGDSGSGFMNATGGAIGVLSTLQIAPLAGSNGVGDIGKEIAYMQANSSLSGASLVPGTEPFKADLLGAIGGA